MTLFHQQLGLTGPAIVGLHGLATANRLLSLRLTALADSARLYFPDLLGHGQSPWPVCAYALRDHLDALHQWRHAAGLAAEPVYLLGVSLGAILALHYAAREPEWYGTQTVRGIVAVSTPAYPDPETARAVVARTSLIAYLTVRRPALAARLCRFLCGVGGRGWTYCPRLFPWLPSDLVQDTFAHCWNSVSGTLEQIVLNPRIPEALSELPETPVLFIHGDCDRLAPFRYLHAALAPWPGANIRLQVLKGADHDAIETRRAEVIEAVRAFIGVGNPSPVAQALRPVA